MSQKCLTLPNTEFATLILENNQKAPFNINDTIKYKCSNGYIFKDASIVRSKKYPVFTCKLKNNVAEWDFDEEACKPVNCGHPGFVENANKIGNEYFFPKAVIYKCHEGYKMATAINSTWCTVRGIWLPDPASIKCVPEKITCPKPTPNAYKDIWDVGEVFPFHCPQTNTDMVLKCKEDGQWTKINCNNDSNNVISNININPSNNTNTINNVNLNNAVNPKNSASLSNNVNPTNTNNKNKNVSLHNMASLSNNTILENNLISSNNANSNNNAGNSFNNIISNKSIIPINNMTQQSKQSIFKNKFIIFVIICLIAIFIFIIKKISTG